MSIIEPILILIFTTQILIVDVCDLVLQYAAAIFAIFFLSSTYTGLPDW